MADRLRAPSLTAATGGNGGVDDIQHRWLRRCMAAQAEPAAIPDGASGGQADPAVVLIGNGGSGGGGGAGGTTDGIGASGDPGGSGGTSLLVGNGGNGGVGGMSGVNDNPAQLEGIGEVFGGDGGAGGDGGIFMGNGGLGGAGGNGAAGPVLGGFGGDGGDGGNGGLVGGDAGGGGVGGNGAPASVALPAAAEVTGALAVRPARPTLADSAVPVDPEVPTDWRDCLDLPVPAASAHRRQHDWRVGLPRRETVFRRATVRRRLMLSGLRVGEQHEMVGTYLLVAGDHPCAPNVARADTADDSFVKVLADQGDTGDPSQFVAEGHTVCDDVSNSHLATNAPGWTNWPALGPVLGDLHLSLPLVDFFFHQCGRILPSIRWAGAPLGFHALINRAGAQAGDC